MYDFTFKKKLLSFILCILIGLSLSIVEANVTINSVVASNTIKLDLIVDDELENRGKQAYRGGNYQEALILWQKALNSYQQQQDVLSQGRVLSNLALANYQLGNWSTAQAEIQQSRQLLESQQNQDDFERTLGQVLNNQGIIELAVGKSESAIAVWNLAISAYQKAGDSQGEIHARLNQAQALKSIGLYQRAKDSFTELDLVLKDRSDSLFKVVALRSYGELLRLMGEISQSEAILKDSLAIASRLSLATEEVKSLLALGNTLVAHGDKSYYQEALEHYQKAMKFCTTISEKTSEKSNFRASSTLNTLAPVTPNIGGKLGDFKLFSPQNWGRLFIFGGNLRIHASARGAKISKKVTQRISQTNSNCAETDLSLQINLAQLNLLLKTESWNQGIKLVSLIQQQFSQLAVNRELLDFKISFANDLITLRQQSPEKSSEIPAWSEITAFLNSAIADSQQLNYTKGESYSWGLQGKIQEILGQWEDANQFTTKALNISQVLNAPEISYLWAWQLGRIERAKGDRQTAIAHYRQAITLLDSLNNDLANVGSNLQYSFRNTIEPVYRETVALLLDASPSQENLIQARDTIESLQLAELQNFFREACLKGKSVPIDSLDNHAAALYPIILRDRLVLILSLPHQPLQYYSVAVSQEQLEATIEQLRQTVVIRSRRDFYQPASELYNWLINPIALELETHQIKTIVFVPDGALRNIPLAALYNGKNYLVEHYNLVLNPGLQLLNPRSLKDTKLKILAVGLTEERDNFAALEYVNLELAKIQEQVKSAILLNEDFTTQALQQKIKFSDYPIIHIATHGQFSSSLEQTFLLAWDKRININQLNQILQTRTGAQQEAIELLVLSACETAAGDKWAALGLAGIAIRAGAKSTIATLWSINDKATAQLMGTLYQAMTTQSVGKAEALHQAQLSLLHDPQYKHPFYWAAYTLIGNWL
jgi:CHAT domain-containing protein